jgi:23S rRNA pseudouridine1911/1915/1917 synthase
MPHSWTVKFADAGKRLDIFLTEHLKSVTRAQLKKQIDAGGYTVNGKRVAVHRFLKEGDVVVEGDRRGVIYHAPKRGLINQTPTTNTPPPLNIIKETKEWLVLYKPAELLMHPDTDHENGTLIDAVIAHAPQVAKVGEDPTRPGIMSRLDKDVSGLVVIAKTQHAFDDLKRQFAEHTVHKEYRAVVHGEITKDEGDIKLRIARSTSKARMAASAANAKHGQAAWTHFEVLQRFQGATLLKLQILTGRTHQIRAHLHAFGHPVMGDPLYKPRQMKRKIATPRLFLQSVALTFRDPVTQEEQSFTIPLDPDFETFLTTL